jgi:hypothetical protein
VGAEQPDTRHDPMQAVTLLMTNRRKMGIEKKSSMGGVG